ncbi:amino acid adenylation domain-containing protein [Streptomyces sp. NPDC058252]|uniref:non-ribosomal peptide synthetase n=1 Tax=Streptomyces sp. NPDC058252 TaxID=3346405 RepID=UPI0036F143ED
MSSSRSGPSDLASGTATDSTESREWAEEARAALSADPLGLKEQDVRKAQQPARAEVALEASLHQAVLRMAREDRDLPLVAGLSALAVTLARSTGRTRTVVGSAPGGPGGPAVVPVVLDAPDDSSVAELLSATRASLERSLAQHTATAEDSLSVPVVFTHETPSGSHRPATGAAVCITLQDGPDQQSAALVATAPTGRYTAPQLGRFLAGLRTVLAALLDARQAPVGALSPLDEAQTGELLALGRGPALPSHDLRPVHALVADAAAEDGEQPAVVCGEDTVTRGQLQAWSARITSRLTATGVGRGDRVGILAERSTAAVAALLGALGAGAAYVPVDPLNPDERVTAVLRDADVSAVVVTGSLGERLSGLGLPLVQADDPALRAGAGDQATTAGTEAVHPSLAGGPEEAALPDGPEAALPGDPEDAAYLIYTSGSTGAPKGVLVEHGHLAASTLARRQVYPGRPVFLLLSPLAFDSSAAGLWGALTAGGRLVVADQNEFRAPDQVVRLVERHEVTHILCVPSFYDTVLAAAERDGLHRLRTLSTVIVAGEALPEALVHRHAAALGDTALVNEYGPTEATVWASHRRCDPSRPVDIGGPIPGARLYVLDDAGRLVPRGATGELYIGGAGVSRGYFGRAEETRRAFVHDPFAGDGSRMYRTGDLVRWSEEGTVEFLGRRDNQVKIRGHRVELEAVEAALRACPGVRDAVVVPDADRSRLIGFVRAEGDLDLALTRKRVAGTLPEVAVPAQLHSVDAFPTTANGKTDRAALTEQVSAQLAEQASAQGQQALEAPQADTPGADGLVHRVAAAWAEVLKVSDVPTTVNFFDLGGHSLLVIRLQTALEDHTGVRPSSLDLYRCTTVKAQAELIGAGATEPATTTDSSADRAERVRKAREVRAHRARARRETL